MPHQECIKKLFLDLKINLFSPSTFFHRSALHLVLMWTMRKRRMTQVPSRHKSSWTSSRRTERRTAVGIQVSLEHCLRNLLHLDSRVSHM